VKKHPSGHGPSELNSGGSPDGRSRGGAAAASPHPDGATSLRIVIPESHSMVSLLGSRDELLQVIENAFDSDIHVRGNEITVTGSASEAAIIGEVFDELTRLLASGTEVTTDLVERSVAMLRRKSGARPAEVLTSDRRRSTRSGTSTRSTITPSSSRSVRLAPARPTWPWRKRSRHSRPRK
jgi:phosphate starvation-inducible protein PhoH